MLPDAAPALTSGAHRPELPCAKVRQDMSARHRCNRIPGAVFVHGERCETLDSLLQVLCRGQCCVPGSFAWALALSSVRRQSSVVTCGLEMLGDVSWHKEPLSGSTVKRASASSR